MKHSLLTVTTLLDSLRIILTQAESGALDDERWGIGLQLNNRAWTSDEEELFGDIYKMWPKYSGIPKYPIGNGFSDYESNHFKFIGKQGVLRRELLKFAIAELTDKVTMTNSAMKYGLILNAGSLWVGIHYSKHNKRVCINILPMCTIWFCPHDGVAP